MRLKGAWGWGLAIAIVILLSLIVFFQCPGDTGVKGIRDITVRPRQPQPRDTWCVYTTTAESDAGAIPAGGDICVYCPPGTTQCEASVRTITVAPGVTYNVGIGGEGMCSACPKESQDKGWTYEKVN